MNVCVLRHHLAGHQAFGAQLRLLDIALTVFGTYFHVLGPPYFNSELSQKLVDCLVVKARPRVATRSHYVPGAFNPPSVNMQTADKEI